MKNNDSFSVLTHDAIFGAEFGDLRLAKSVLGMLNFTEAGGRPVPSSNRDWRVLSKVMRRGSLLRLSRSWKRRGRGGPHDGLMARFL
jgi:hypothetical protein